MIQYLNLDSIPFSLIKNGRKDVEMRIYNEYRKLIQIGDIIEFTNRETHEKLSVEVTNLQLFPTFVELYQHYDKQRLGYKPDEIADPADMEIYYSKQLIEEHGVMAIEIKLIDVSAR